MLTTTPETHRVITWPARNPAPSPINGRGRGYLVCHRMERANGSLPVVAFTPLRRSLETVTVNRPRFRGRIALGAGRWVEQTPATGGASTLDRDSGKKARSDVAGAGGDPFVRSHLWTGTARTDPVSAERSLSPSLM